MNDILNFAILTFGEFNLKVSSIVLFFLFIGIVIFLLYLIKKAIFSTSIIDIAKKSAIYSLIKYCILVFSFVIGLQILGFNLSVLLAGSAALLVGIGLGLQSLFSDFVSGIIILIDSTVKVNDIIEVNGLVCKVLQINLRTTMVLTRDDKYLILPNSDLTKNQLINWTHGHIASRFDVMVGVDYSSDIKLVMRICEQAAFEHEGVLNEPVPFVRFTEYAESSLNFCICFWTEEVFRVEQIKSEIRVKVFESFKENQIIIPFPQRVIHMNR